MAAAAINGKSGNAFNCAYDVEAQHCMKNETERERRRGRERVLKTLPQLKMNWQFSPNIGRIVASCNSIEIAWVTIDARGKRGNRDMNKLLLSVAITQAIYIYTYM